jgi:hypothetical protein
MPRRRIVRMIIVLLLLVAASTCPLLAQPPDTTTLTLDSLLDRLQSNLIDYHHSVPDLFCSEHVQSLLRGIHASIRTTTDSLFRLRRAVQPDHTTIFEESRDIKLVNGKPPTGTPDNISGPAILYGVFSYGLDIISNEARACIEFKLHPIRSDHPTDPILLDFKTLPEAHNNPRCSSFEKTFGRATIDPESLHVIRIEKTTPHHQIFTNRSGPWNWTVEYAPVQLIGKTFWMPKTIHSKSTDDNFNYTWIFDGTYTDYHRFHAEARILPATP